MSLVSIKINNSSLKTFALPIFSFSTLFILLYLSYSELNAENINTLVRKFELKYLFFALFFLIFHQLIASIRFNFLKKKLGSNISFIQSNEINIQSLIYKTFFILPIFLEIIGRSTHSKLIGDRGFSNTISVTMIEKLSSLLVILAIILLLLFIQFDLYQLNTMYLMYYSFIFLFIIILFFILYVINSKFHIFKIQQLKEGFLELVKQQNKYVFLLSFLIHLTSIFALYFLLLQFYSKNNSFLLMMSSFIIASQMIPVSIGGWGTREMTALITFNYFGTSFKEGVLCATIFGLIYLLALFINWTINHSVLKLQKDKNLFQSNYVHKFTNYRSFVYFFSFMIFAFLSINFFLPVNGFDTKFSIADSFALVLGLSIFVSWFLRQRKRIWIGNYTGKIFVLLLLTLIIGWFIGFINFNSNSWAYVNRLSGSLIIICYLFTGLGIAKFIKTKDLDNFVYLFIITIYSSIIFQYFFYIYFNVDELNIYSSGENSLLKEVIGFLRWSEGTPSGFFYDKNALGFSLLCSIGYLFSKISNNTFKKHDIYLILFSSFLIILSGSRSSLLTLSILLGFTSVYYYFSESEIHPWIKKTIYSVIFMICAFLLILLMHFISSKGNTLTPLIDLTGARGISEYFTFSEHRLYIIFISIKSFLNNPFFGLGLGGFVELKESGNLPEYCIKLGFSSSCPEYTVIHSSHLWIATEFGLYGTIAYILFFLNIYNSSKLLNYNDLRKPLILNIILIFIIFSCFHDVMYQRILWIFLGFSLAYNKRKTIN